MKQTNVQQIDTATDLIHRGATKNTQSISLEASEVQPSWIWLIRQIVLTFKMHFC